MTPRNASSSYGSTISTAYPPLNLEDTTTSRPITGRTNTSRQRTRTRTAASTLGGHGDQQIICAITESRGISPTVGLVFVNISTTEAVLCQIADNQTYVRTLHKLTVFEPSEILIASTALHPNKSKLYSIIESNLNDLPITPIDRKYWAKTTGVEYIQHLAFKEDIEAIKVSIGGNFFATCCLAAALKYIEFQLSISFPFHSMRMKYEPSEGSMMIDLSTIHTMELIQNLQNAKSKDCLFGLLNHTLTPMGSRLLRSNILQPLTEEKVLGKRYDALEELTTREEMFFSTRTALKAFLDVDRILTNIIIEPTKPSIQHTEQSINNVIMLKQFIQLIQSVHEALSGVTSTLLSNIRQLCAPEVVTDYQKLIDHALNEDATYQSKPIDLRNQRTYAVKSGVNGLLDVARQTYHEANQDAFQLITDLSQVHQIKADIVYDTARQYYIKIPISELEDRTLPEVFINSYRRKNVMECQTLDLVKLNQKIMDSHHEVLQMSDRVIQELIDGIREDVAPLFKISESIAMLDMIASLADLVTTQNYSRPELTQTLAIKDGRHPVREKIHDDKYIPNDVYATQQNRFQIITGCNMSGKSTYIQSIALMQVMAQIGSFVPASYASFSICHQLFARVSTDDSIEANVSTFAAEMRETAFILHNVDRRSLVIIDELGRGTSTRDGLAIAIAIAEALVESRALVWFVTHFRDLARFMAERPGVVNLHLSVNMSQADRMMMLYKIRNGYVQEEHYGLALAKVAALPQDVIDTAEHVSKTLSKRNEQRKRSSKIVIQAQRNKVILALKEQLVQAKEGKMQGHVLRTWCMKLQDEFVRRMDALDKEARAADNESEELKEEQLGGIRLEEEQLVHEQLGGHEELSEEESPQSGTASIAYTDRAPSMTTDLQTVGEDDDRYKVSGALQMQD